MELRRKIEDAVAMVRQKSPMTPEVGIVLGTGLSELSAAVVRETSLPYEAIPHFARATGLEHRSEMVFGRLDGKPVVVLEGRFHAYEGYTPEQITFPIRVLRALGVRAVVLSNICGAMNSRYQRGDLVLIDDHINLMGFNPLVGPNDDALGPRFPDMARPYDPELLEAADAVAKGMALRAHHAIYAAVPGPSLETRAEYRFLRTIGADVVGMSTVPEVIVAVHSGLRVLGAGIVTDLCDPDALLPVNVPEIIATARAAEPKLTKLVRETLKRARI
ncbi:MAG: purine-nucleoside phosphorylase [Planctomycetes bacterium]|nr:purine-nucleoside phosphorylase [Planctomycetota bacterium]